MPRKKYSINWEDDVPVSFEVDGKSYESLDDLPDEADRLRFEAMLNSTLDAEFDAEFAKMDKEIQQVKGPAVENIILWAFTGIATLMLLIAGIAMYNNILKINREDSAPGHVVEMISRREYINEQDRVFQDYYYPVVEFVSSDGKAHKVQLSEGSSTPSHEVGDEVVVLYEPEHPLDARIKSVGSSALMWILPGITGILGIAFLGAVFVVRRFMPTEE
ncbi:MAG TPA: DUF3592 domain-containing protein [Anaerolineales bacterium]|nr:DUF3592 domain-containing protein [Anaerolineales bacterium]